MTGWSRQEASGRPLQELLQIADVGQTNYYAMASGSGLYSRVGKTHLAISLAIAVAESGVSARYIRRISPGRVRIMPRLIR
jgi:hypothetical protein